MTTDYKNWKELIISAMEYYEDSFDNLVYTTLTESEILQNFYIGYGGTEGIPFTLWTEKRVYFPVCYDGIE